MDVGFAGRVTFVIASGLLAGALLLFGVSRAPGGFRRPRPRYHRRLNPAGLSANLMSYVAVAMAVLLGGAVALTS